MAHFTFRCLAERPVTEWLLRWAEGDFQAAEDLAQSLLPLLERAARAAIRANQRGAVGYSLRDLIHDVWLRVSPSARKRYPDRETFYAAVMQQMRFVLIDRYRHALLESGPSPLFIDCARDSLQLQQELDVQRALRELLRRNERAGRAFLMRELLESSLEEVATALGVSLATVKRDLTFARARLQQLLATAEPNRPD